MILGKKIIYSRDEFLTLQDAINYAETLPEAESGVESSGIVIEFNGYVDEDLTITKNVSLVSYGGFVSKIDSLTIKPKSAEVCPQNILISGLYITEGLTITNNTGGDVFNPSMGLYAISVENCVISGLDVTNVNYMKIRNSNFYTNSTVFNVPEMDIFYCTFLEGSFTFTGDSQAPNQPSSEDNESYTLQTFFTYMPDLTVTTVPGSEFPAVHNDFCCEEE